MQITLQRSRCSQHCQQRSSSSLPANIYGPGSVKQRDVQCAVVQAPSIVVDDKADEADAGLKAPASVEDALQISNYFTKGFSTSLYKEYNYWIKEIDGEIPAGLKGTFIRNGPGLFEVGGKPLAHPFDGDGLICSLSVDGTGKAFFQNKYVRTPAFLAERRTGKPQFRSTFNRGLPESGGIAIPLGPLGTVRLTNPFDIQVKDAANTNVLRWGGKTLALYEAGPPHALGPALETLGPDTLGGSMAQPIMNAHLKITQEEDGTSRAVMFSSGIEGGRDGKLFFYEYAQDFTLMHRTEAKLPGAAFGFFHDMAVSEHYYVVIENPIKMNFMQFLLDVPRGRASIAECLKFQQSEPAKLHLIPRPGRGTPPGVLTYPVPGAAFFTFHHGNAWETEDGRHLVLDSCSSGSVDFSVSVDTVGPDYYGNARNRVEPSRIVVDLNAPVHPSAVRRSVMTQRSTEFPTVAPSKVGRGHRYTYLAASPVAGGAFFGPNQALIKMTVDPNNGVYAPFDRSAVKEEMWQPSSPFMFPGEPVFVPREGGREEDDGWLMSWIYDAEHNRSSMVILDAQRLSEGPVATLYLDNHHIPSGLHGMWSREYLGPAPGTLDSPPYDIRNGV